MDNKGMKTPHLTSEKGTASRSLSNQGEVTLRRRRTRLKKPGCEKSEIVLKMIQLELFPF